MVGEFGGAGECDSDDRKIYPGIRVALAGAGAIKCLHLENIFNERRLGPAMDFH